MKRHLLIIAFAFTALLVGCSGPQDWPQEHTAAITKRLGDGVSIRQIQPPDGPFTLREDGYWYYIAVLPGFNERAIWVRVWMSVTNGWTCEFYEHTLFDGYRRVTM